MPRPRRSLLALALIVLTVLLTGCDPASLAAPPSATRTTASSAASTTDTQWAITTLLTGVSPSQVSHIGQTLDALPVQRPASMAGYSREKFPHWLDASTWGWKTDIPNSCDAREAALIRDGRDVEFTSRYCTVKAGLWVEPYNVVTSTVPRGLDIDHMVPLANAWRSGANAWTTEQRTRFANDPLVLVTTGSSENREKGDKGPEAWKPPNKQVRCAYAIRWVTIKDAYHLALTSTAEHDALAAMLDSCSVGLPQQDPSTR